MTGMCHLDFLHFFERFDVLTRCSRWKRPDWAPKKSCANARSPPTAFPRIAKL
jgi:hypothetical protein